MNPWQVVIQTTLLLLCIATPPLLGDSLACTLFGAAGSPVQGGGVLVGKIRDLAPEAWFRLGQSCKGDFQKVSF
ncbi:MAG: hypothetical protein QME78_04945 [Thermodesulfobacteriota bacterium]|nr:hypothetical protein [Thermodesulfobacteriota bacterium]